MRFVVFREVKISMLVFCIFMSCGLVGRYQLPMFRINMLPLSSGLPTNQQAVALQSGRPTVTY
jgi:hypothetical protein